MANASVTALVNRRNVATALQAARIECEQYQSWLNALNRAALNLEACSWQFDGDILRIGSTSSSSTRYTVTPQGCGCKAHQKGNPCWHRAARRLLIKASELAELAQEMSAAEGLALPDALGQATAEYGQLQSYAHAWDLATVQRQADELYA